MAVVISALLYIFNEYFRIRKANGEIDIEREYFETKNQNYESDAIKIGELKNPAEIVRICESIDMPFPIIRNGYDELYVMSYREYMRRKAIITFVKKLFEIRISIFNVLFQKYSDFLK